MVMSVMMRTIVKCCIFLKECPGCSFRSQPSRGGGYSRGWSFGGPLIYKSASLGMFI